MVEGRRAAEEAATAATAARVAEEGRLARVRLVEGARVEWQAGGGEEARGAEAKVPAVVVASMAVGVVGTVGDAAAGSAAVAE